MFSNLVSNAVNHGADDQPVEITGRHGPMGLEISVRNGGRPIPADAIEKLFLPFKRGEASHGGLGLGLFIALEIAKARGGTIDVFSDHTETCFTFRMPMSR